MTTRAHCLRHRTPNSPQPHTDSVIWIERNAAVQRKCARRRSQRLLVSVSIECVYRLARVIVVDLRIKKAIRGIVDHADAPGLTKAANPDVGGVISVPVMSKIWPLLDMT